MKKIKTLKDEYAYYGLERYLAPNETPEMAEGFFLTALNQKDTGLAMCINLRCIENKGEKPFLRFQNDRDTKHNCNWVKMYLDGSIANYENKTIIFTEQEMQELKNWIILNKEAIEKHYYQEYDSPEVLSKLKLKEQE